MSQVLLTDWSMILNRATGGNSGAQEIINSSKAGRIAGVAAAQRIGLPGSTWLWDGQQPSAGSKPSSSASNPTRATAGAVGQVNPSGGNKKYLLHCEFMSKDRLAAGLYDRLAHISGLSATTTTAQNISSLSVSRYTGTESAGNEIWLEIYTQIGATGTTVSASYTNEGGTSGRTTASMTFGGTDYREANRLIRLPLQSGDRGVRSVESVTVLATTGTAGDFGVTIMRSIDLYSTTATALGEAKASSFAPGPAEIKTDACLFWVIHTNATTAAVTWINAQLAFVEGS